MSEPLTVQVNRIRNSQHSPIPLPPGGLSTEGGQTSGAGWTKGEVMEMVNGWLVNHWSGGGHYEFMVTDSTIPTPLTLKWRSWWSPNEHPERIPPSLADGARPMPAPTPIVTQQPTQVSMPAFQSGLPQLPPNLAPAPTGYGYYAPPQTYGYPPPATPYQAQAQAQDAERRRMEDQLAAMRAQLDNARAEAQQRAYQADLERQRAEHAAMVQRLEQRIAEMAQAQARPAVNPEIEALKEQNRLLQQEREAERREREMDRRERETREMVASLKAGIDAQIVAMQNQFQQLIAASSANKNDPMIQYMVQQSQNSIAAMERISTQSAAMMKELQPFMMSPRDMMAMARDANSGVDAITSKLANSYQNVIEMQGKVIENAMQLNQGGSPTVDLIREGVNGVKELASRYVTSTNRAKTVEAQANAEVARAQAQAQAVTAQANAAIAQTQMRAQQPQIASPPPTPRPMPQQSQAGLAGAATVAQGNAFEQWRKQRDGNVQPAPQPRETASAAPRPTPTSMANQPPPVSSGGRKIHGRTDSEWFGLALSEVMQTRAAVRAFMQKMHKAAQSEDPPPLDENDATAEKVAQGIAMAAGQVQAMGVSVPAMTDLLMQGKYEEFMQVLLPEAPPAYHEDVIYEFRVMNGEIDPEEDADEEQEAAEAAAEVAEEAHEHEDGSPSDDVVDGSSVKPQSKIRVVHPARA